MAIEGKQHAITVLQSNAAALRAVGVQRLALVGSFVRHERSADSDVDLLVEFVLGRRFDLVASESLSPYIGPYILREVEYVALTA